MVVTAMIYKILSYSFPLYFNPLERGVLGIMNSVVMGTTWLYDHSLEMFLLWAGRFSKDFKNNVKGYFSAIVLLSTFRLNLARAKALKSNQEHGIKSVDM